jgi:hypothetical protein
MGIVLGWVGLSWTGLAGWPPLPRHLFPSRPIADDSRCSGSLLAWHVGMSTEARDWDSGGMGAGDRNVDCGVMRHSDRRHAVPCRAVFGRHPSV